MNSYKLKKGQKPSKEMLRAIALGLFYSGENYLIDDDAILFRVPFSMSNIDLPSNQLIQLAYDSKYQSTMESMDKPVIETGDLIICAVDPTKNNVKEYLNNYVKIPEFLTNGKSKFDILIGYSNSSKSDFNEPFKDVLFVAINVNTFIKQAPRTLILKTLKR